MTMQSLLLSIVIAYFETFCIIFRIESLEPEETIYNTLYMFLFIYMVGFSLDYASFWCEWKKKTHRVFFIELNAKIVYAIEHEY